MITMTSVTLFDNTWTVEGSGTADTPAGETAVNKLTVSKNPFWPSRRTKTEPESPGWIVCKAGPAVRVKSGRGRTAISIPFGCEIPVLVALSARL